MFLRGGALVHTPTNPHPLPKICPCQLCFFSLNRNEMLVLYNLNLINLYMYIIIIYVNTGIVLINKIIVH